MMLRQFEYLVALARERHFGRAAAACNVSQPTLSAAIRQLEEELGAPIVERGHKFHGLTAQGRAALDHAHRILAETSALKRDLEEMDRGLSGRLRIGGIPTALPIVAHITAPFYERFPNVSVTVLSLNSQQIQQGIDNFELDVGLTYLDNEPLTNVRAKPIYVEQYMFLTPAAGALARRRSITWKEASSAPLCLLTPDMQNRRIIDGIFRSVDAAPNPAMETNSIFNLCSHVASGLWSSIVPVQLLQFFGVPRGARALPLVEPSAQRTIGLIMADREPPSPLARNLLAIERPADIGSRILPPLAAPEEGAIDRENLSDS
jgi:DNA-binding transcriptional LysR family regulator